jgi:hypothetical protein
MCEFLSSVWASCKEHGSDIVCSIIETAGVIVAARIGVGGLKKIAKDRFDTYFTSFSSKNHDLERILNRAEKEITIIVVYGDNLLETYKPLLADRLKQGIKINFLMLTKDKAQQMTKDYYNDSDEKFRSRYKKSLEYLMSLSESNNFKVRMCELPLSASYIAIDCGIENTWRMRDALIQIMVYQYGVKTPKAPITYLSHGTPDDILESTIDSLQNMWSKGREEDLSSILASLDGEYIT